jgi:hypothetical protein
MSSIVAKIMIKLDSTRLLLLPHSPACQQLETLDRLLLPEYKYKILKSGQYCTLAAVL